MICHWQQLNNQTASEIVKGVMGLWLHSGFAKQGTDEAQNRLENIQELYNAVQQFEEESFEATRKFSAPYLLIWMTCKREHASAHDLPRG